MNDGHANSTSCCGIEVRTDTTKLSNTIIARFGEGRNYLVGKGKVFIKHKTKVAGRVDVSSYVLSPTSTNSVLED